MMTDKLDSDRLRVEQVCACAIRSSGCECGGVLAGRAGSGWATRGRGLTFEDDTETALAYLLAHSVVHSNHLATALRVVRRRRGRHNVLGAHPAWTRPRAREGRERRRGERGEERRGDELR